MSNQHKFSLREKDWRNGAIVYQIFVDRFAPAKNLDAKKEFYQTPKVLKSWSETPKPGPFLDAIRYCAHELEYWGGDIQSLKEKLDYIKSLGVKVIYLNPIFYSLSNHKYDTSDYLKISPEYGTFDDLQSLTEEAHKAGMRLMLDGVFNHVGVTSSLFKDAKEKKNGKESWFDFNPKYHDGVRLWADARSLPELNLENEEVRNYIYKNDDSVIKTYLKHGVDGWRLDVAFDIGYHYLKELTDEAHIAKDGSMIVGEIWNYPETWLKSIDGVMNFTFREIILRTVEGYISPSQATKMISKAIEDAGIEPILKSWNLLDNHDVPRLKNLLLREEDQRLAQVLQFTLPGSPNLYYGTELGMDGGHDPMNRAPMRWDLVSESNRVLQWTKQLIDMHQQERALKIGDYLPIISEKLMCFERKTDRVEDTVIVIINPSDNAVEEDIMIPDSNLMNYSKFELILGDAQPTRFVASLMTINLPKKSFVVLKPKTKPEKSYTAYKRV